MAIELNLAVGRPLRSRLNGAADRCLLVGLARCVRDGLASECVHRPFRPLRALRPCGLSAAPSG